MSYVLSKCERILAAVPNYSRFQDSRSPLPLEIFIHALYFMVGILFAGATMVKDSLVLEAPRTSTVRCQCIWKKVCWDKLVSLRRHR